MQNVTQSPFSLNGKIALVTGATRGLGAGMAIGLAEAGADIIGVGTRDMATVKRDVIGLGRNFYEIKEDLSKGGAANRIKVESLRLAGRVDILVNNAGIIRRSPPEQYSDDDWDDVIQINLKAVFQLCREIGNHMLERGSGKIINIASLLSFQGGIRVPAYTASKHAVAGLTKALSNEWSGRGVCVNAIAPGYMETDVTLALREDAVRNDSILKRIPAGRWGTPDDLKGPVVFLASAASNYINGHILSVDGGWMGY